MEIFRGGAKQGAEKYMTNIEIKQLKNLWCLDSYASTEVKKLQLWNSDI